MTVARLRQITSVVTKRLDAAARVQRSYIEWQTKAISSFIVGAASQSEEQAKALFANIEDLTMLGEVKEQTPESEKKDLWVPGMPSQAAPNPPDTLSKLAGGLGVS